MKTNTWNAEFWTEGVLVLFAWVHEFWFYRSSSRYHVSLFRLFKLVMIKDWLLALFQVEFCIGM
jgi:hypothetical protein